MKSHHVDLLNEAIAPALTRLALPIMATSLVQMLYNLTDMAWIGRLGALYLRLSMPLRLVSGAATQNPH